MGRACRLRFATAGPHTLDECLAEMNIQRNKPVRHRLEFSDRVGEGSTRRSFAKSTCISCRQTNYYSIYEGIEVRLTIG